MNNTEKPIIRADKETATIPRGFVATESVSHVMTQKVVIESTLYRQKQEWKGQGIGLSCIYALWKMVVLTLVV